MFNSKKLFSFLVAACVSMSLAAQPDKHHHDGHHKHGHEHHDGHHAHHGEHKNHTPEERAQFRTDRMEKSLNLDAKQKEKVLALNLKNEKEKAAIFEKYPRPERPSKEEMEKNKGEHKRPEMNPEMKKELEALNASYEKDLKKILSKEQLATYETKKAEMQERMKEGKGHGHHGKGHGHGHGKGHGHHGHGHGFDKHTPEEAAQFRTNHMEKALNLDAKQKEQVLALNLKNEKEVRAIFEKYPRPERPSKEEMEKNKGEHKRPEINPEMKKDFENLGASYEQELKGILNQEQFNKFLNHKEEMRKRFEERKQKHQNDDSVSAPLHHARPFSEQM